MHGHLSNASRWFQGGSWIRSHQQAHWFSTSFYHFQNHEMGRDTKTYIIQAFLRIQIYMIIEITGGTDNPLAS